MLWEAMYGVINHDMMPPLLDTPDNRAYDSSRSTST